jgi:hypothetical protein
MTPEERRAAKDKQLDDSLGDFDTTLRKEQARIAREREARRSGASSEGGSGSGEGGGVGDAPGGADKGEKGDKGDKSDSGRSGDAGRRDGDMKSSKQEAKTGGSSSQGKGPSTAPPEAGSGEDDDIVARQLREAAEKETDPELREKLWKEYIEYKKSAKH